MALLLGVALAASAVELDPAVPGAVVGPGPRWLAVLMVSLVAAPVGLPLLVLVGLELVVLMLLLAAAPTGLPLLVLVEQSKLIKVF